MDNLSLYTQLNSLPQHLKDEVQDFIEFLKMKADKSKKPSKRKFGCLQGKINMSDDFDQPLEDFNEYS